MANRLLQRQYPDNLNDEFQYDSASRLTQAVSNRYQITVTRAYNEDSTIATEGLSTNGENFQISHLYDNAKRANLTTYPNGKVLGKAFTNRSQLSSIAYDSNLMANFQYDLGMREVSRGVGNGLTQTTSYRLDNLIQQKTVVGITNFSYTYDANKRKTSETDAVNTNLNQTFAYDFEDRLTSWSSNGTTLNQTQSWSLSLEGAWNSTTVNGNTENRTFNQTYEILTSNANAMTHDRKGNLTTNKDGSLYTWDFNNQLAFSTAGTPSVNAAYAYDALGRRVSKSSGNTITVFVHTNYQIATEYKSINGGAFTENQSFVYATYIDDPIALISSNGTYFYHSNQQYSISAITDSNGNLSERYGYNAYGKPVVITDSILVDNPYFFTGRQLDSETGLFYFRARYYDANLGQFISRDPIGFVDGKNLYRGYFAINDMDPSGWKVCCKETWEKWQKLGYESVDDCLLDMVPASFRNTLRRLLDPEETTAHWIVLAGYSHLETGVSGAGGVVSQGLPSAANSAAAYAASQTAVQAGTATQAATAASGANLTAGALANASNIAGQNAALANSASTGLRGTGTVLGAASVGLYIGDQTFGLIYLSYARSLCLGTVCKSKVNSIFRQVTRQRSAFSICRLWGSETFTETIEECPSGSFECEGEVE